MKSIISKKEFNFSQKYSKFVSWFSEKRQKFLHNRLESIVYEKIMYMSNGKKISWYIVSPKQIKEECAVIIYNKWWNNNQDFWWWKWDLSPRELFITMWFYAQQWFIVVASNYSGGRDCDGIDEFGGEDVDDIINLYWVIQSIKGADISKIWMLGYSRGGMMTYMCMMRKLPWLKSCATIWWITDLVGLSKSRPKMLENVYIPLFGGSEDDMKKRSALYRLDDMDKTIPLYILHGNDDERVAVSMAIEFVWNAIDSGLSIRAQFYEDGNHYLTNHIKETSQYIKNRFEKTLKYIYIYIVQKSILTAEQK